jgi:hypothetical protein
MTDLLLQPTGDPDDFEVMAEGQVVGRIVLLAGIWSWAIGTVPVYGDCAQRGLASYSSSSPIALPARLTRCAWVQAGHVTTSNVSPSVAGPSSANHACTFMPVVGQR